MLLEANSTMFSAGCPVTVLESPIHILVIKKAHVKAIIASTQLKYCLLFEHISNITFPFHTSRVLFSNSICNRQIIYMYI